MAVAAKVGCDKQPFDPDRAAAATDIPKVLEGARCERRECQRPDRLFRDLAVIVEPVIPASRGQWQHVSVTGDLERHANRVGKFAPLQLLRRAFRYPFARTAKRLQHDARRRAKAAVMQVVPKVGDSRSIAQRDDDPLPGGQMRTQTGQRRGMQTKAQRLVQSPSRPAAASEKLDRPGNARHSARSRRSWQAMCRLRTRTDRPMQAPPSAGRAAPSPGRSPSEKGTGHSTRRAPLSGKSDKWRFANPMMQSASAMASRLARHRPSGPSSPRPITVNHGVSDMRPNLLILGGTTEGRRLCKAVADAGLAGTVSMAGRVSSALCRRACRCASAGLAGCGAGAVFARPCDHPCDRRDPSLCRANEPQCHRGLCADRNTA